MIDIIHDDDELHVGYINLMGRSYPGLAIRRKRESLRGLAFDSRKKLEAAIEFLQKARQDLYGAPKVPKKIRAKSTKTSKKTKKRS